MGSNLTNAQADKHHTRAPLQLKVHKFNHRESLVAVGRQLRKSVAVDLGKTSAHFPRIDRPSVQYFSSTKSANTAATLLKTDQLLLLLCLPRGDSFSYNISPTSTNPYVLSKISTLLHHQVSTPNRPLISSQLHASAGPISPARLQVMDELPGKDVAFDFYARFEPKEILGRGVSSTVRRCIEKATGNEYAAKIIDVSADMEDSTGCTLRQATWREISVLRMMSGHRYIIELYEVFESSTYIFLVFELCKNGELFDYLTKVVALSEKKTRQIMKQLFEAVDYVHSKNVVHRDLKPENILLDDDFNIKLSDFGFAKPLAPNEALFELCGTPGYLAPELLRAALCEGSQGYAQAVDLWACGVVMYTLLAGFPPFWHRRQYQMLRSIMEGKYAFRSPEWDSITDAPKDLIRKLLTMEPEKRINAAEALKHEFFAGMPRLATMSARRRFKMICIVVRVSIRVRKLRFTPESWHLESIRQNPYVIKSLRKAIDGCAFRVYQHWVKRGDLQNRAALFANA